MKPIRGTAYLFGDDVNTDVLHPSRYYSLSPETRAAGMLANVEDDSLNGRIVVAGRNFGVGSSRESVIRGFVESGIVAIVAAGISRIFQRNAINAGLPAIICREAGATFSHGERIVIDIERNLIGAADGRIELALEPLPQYWRLLLAKGGLLAERGWK